jgi:putative oxidoreductase
MGGMPLLRSLTRAGLGASFVAMGWDALLAPDGRTAKAAAIGVPQPETAVTLNGGAMVVAGAALAAGLAPRLSAAVLAGLLVPTTLAGHAYWKESEPGPRAQQRIQFLKNVCMLGGLVEVVLSGSMHRREDR